MSGLSLPEKQHAYWLEGFKKQTYPELVDDIEVDVAIVGGGIAGLTTGYFLQKSGLQVAIIEKHTIGSGTTGGTTGKVTTQHSLIYEELVSSFGKSRAQIYASAAQEALTRVASVITDERIKCDWRAEDNYVYTNDSKRLGQFQREAQTAADLGLPASFVTNLELPFATKGAVKFSGQGTFHVRKYLSGLAKAFTQHGGLIYERSNVVALHEGQPCKVRTHKAAVIAKQIVLATKVPPSPLLGRALYAANEYPETSYIVAGKYDGSLSGMYISPDKGHYSLLPIMAKGGPMLLIGGENHIPGLGASVPRQQKLADYGQKWFKVSEIVYRWKAMDYMAYDKLPLAGPLYAQSKNLYFIGGFKKWGLNLSMACALVIHDYITQQDNPAKELFKPARLSSMLAIPKTVLEHMQS